MHEYLYKLGSYSALTKLGIKLTFDDPGEAQKHYKRRNVVSKVTGAAGNIGGGMLGGTLGSVVPVAGTIAGGIAGAEIGQRAMSAPATLAYDVAHDIPQKAKSQYRSSLSRMNAASGLPSGIGKVPSGIPKQIGQFTQNA